MNNELLCLGEILLSYSWNRKKYFYVLFEQSTEYLIIKGYVTTVSVGGSPLDMNN
jgi:hypothetical protein